MRRTQIAPCVLPPLASRPLRFAYRYQVLVRPARVSNLPRECPTFQPRGDLARPTPTARHRKPISRSRRPRSPLFASPACQPFIYTHLVSLSCAIFLIGNAIIRGLYFQEDASIAFGLVLPLMSMFLMTLLILGLLEIGAILANPKLKLKETDVHIDSEAQLKVYAGKSDRDSTAVFELQRLQLALKEVIVAGIKEISRAIISRKEDGEKTEEERGREAFQLLVEGVGFVLRSGCAAVSGVDISVRTAPSLHRCGLILPHVCAAH